MIWIIASLLAFGVALIVTRLMMGASIQDAPDEARKLHTKLTPTSGGLGIVAGTFVGLLVLVQGGILSASPLFYWAVLLPLFGGALGLLDDLHPLDAKLKLSVMLAAVTAFVVFGTRVDVLDLSPGIRLGLGPFMGAAGTMLWLLVMMNTVNFMDGANGLAMGSAGIGLLCLGALSFHSGALLPAALCGVASTACFGFLRWNAWTGQIFAGDVGALFVGLIAGVAGTLAVRESVHPLAVALCFLPLLADVILTIIWRARCGENILSAHSHHAYQVKIKAGATHGQVASTYWLLTLLCGALAVGADAIGGPLPVGVFIVFLAIAVLLHHSVVGSPKASR